MNAAMNTGRERQNKYPQKFADGRLALSLLSELQTCLPKPQE